MQMVLGKKNYGAKNVHELAALKARLEGARGTYKRGLSPESNMFDW